MPDSERRAIVAQIQRDQASHSVQLPELHFNNDGQLTSANRSEGGLNQHTEFNPVTGKMVSEFDVKHDPATGKLVSEHDEKYDPATGRSVSEHDEKYDPTTGKMVSEHERHSDGTKDITTDKNYDPTTGKLVSEHDQNANGYGSTKDIQYDPDDRKDDF